MFLKTYQSLFIGHFSYTKVTTSEYVRHSSSEGEGWTYHSESVAKLKMFSLFSLQLWLCRPTSLCLSVIIMYAWIMHEQSATHAGLKWNVCDIVWIGESYCKGKKRGAGWNVYSVLLNGAQCDVTVVIILGSDPIVWYIKVFMGFSHVTVWSWLSSVLHQLCSTV